MISSRLNSILPSSVQMAPLAAQSVVAGSTMVTSPLPALTNHLHPSNELQSKTLTGIQLGVIAVFHIRI